MHLPDIMLAHLSVARQVLKAGETIMPAWRVSTADGSFLILTRFDHDNPEQVMRTIDLMKRFMMWKMATGFVLTSEMWLGPKQTREGEEALAVVGVTRKERRALIQRIERKPAIAFGAVQWLRPEEVDAMYFELLPPVTSSLTHQDILELESTFGEDGEFEASRVG